MFMGQENLKSELDQIALELYKKENPGQTKAYIKTSRLSGWRCFGIPVWIGIIGGVQGFRKRKYPSEIAERDELLLLAILQKHSEDSFTLNYVAFNFKDQTALWESVFDVKVKKKEKEKQIIWLKNLIEKKLSQLRMDDVFK